MTQRVYNFSAGPAVLPEEVLQRAQSELMALPGLGMSILEISHRSQPFTDILNAAEANLSTAASHDALAVSVEVPYAQVSWGFMALFAGDTIFRANVVMRKE